MNRRNFLRASTLAAGLAAALARPTIRRDHGDHAARHPRPARRAPPSRPRRTTGWRRFEFDEPRRTPARRRSAALWCRCRRCTRLPGGADGQPVAGQRRPHGTRARPLRRAGMVRRVGAGHRPAPARDPQPLRHPRPRHRLRPAQRRAPGTAARRTHALPARHRAAAHRRHRARYRTRHRPRARRPTRTRRAPSTNGSWTTPSASPRCAVRHRRHPHDAPETGNLSGKCADLNALFVGLARGWAAGTRRLASASPTRASATRAWARAATSPRPSTAAPRSSWSASAGCRWTRRTCARSSWRNPGQTLHGRSQGRRGAQTALRRLGPAGRRSRPAPARPPAARSPDVPPGRSPCALDPDAFSYTLSAREI